MTCPVMFLSYRSRLLSGYLGNRVIMLGIWRVSYPWPIHGTWDLVGRGGFAAAHAGGIVGARAPERRTRSDPDPRADEKHL